MYSAQQQTSGKFHPDQSTFGRMPPQNNLFSAYNMQHGNGSGMAVNNVRLSLIVDCTQWIHSIKFYYKLTGQTEDHIPRIRLTQDPPCTIATPTEAVHRHGVLLGVFRPCLWPLKSSWIPWDARQASRQPCDAITPASFKVGAISNYIYTKLICTAVYRAWIKLPRANRRNRKLHTAETCEMIT